MILLCPKPPAEERKSPKAQYRVRTFGKKYLPRVLIFEVLHMVLDLTHLVNAVERLREGLTRYLADTSDIQIRDGLIQRFEFTYELSHKMLKRRLETASANPTEFDNADFQYLIRSGNEQGLLLSFRLPGHTQGQNLLRP